MQVGIVGFKSSGKTTVFNVLTGNPVNPAGQNTDKPNIGVIKVPDERIANLSSIFKPKKTIFTDIVFTDIQISNEKENKGSSTGIDPNIVSHIRNSDAIVVVVRAFDNPSVPHPANSINPIRDFENYENELRITDFIQIESRLERMKKENKKGIDEAILKKCKEHLESNKPLRLFTFNDTDFKAINGFKFLSQKPLLVLVNTSEGDKSDHAELFNEVKKAGGMTMTLSAQLELEISQLEKDAQKDFLKEMGIEKPARDRFIILTYTMLNLISFFTVGEDEVRAWTIKNGTNAQESAGKIHSDLERGFIRADVISYDDFVSAGTMAKAREKALLRQEGKNYTVKDGDIMEIKFNV